MGQIALSDFEYLPRQRGGGALGGLHSCAYNHSSAFPEDKKKYILLNKNSVEWQKEPRFQEGGRNLPEGGVGMRGNPVFPLRTCRLSNLAKA